MAKGLFREKSLNYISSPEQLNDYLKVTKPAVWIVLIAIIVLLLGLFVWGSFAYIGSSIEGVADVEENTIVMEFKSQKFAENVKEGMNIKIGDTEWPIISVGKDDNGYFAIANTTLEDGKYEATVTYRQTQVMGLLFKNQE